MSDQISPGRVRIVEVGPRDGLQNESRTVPAATKIAFVNALADAGHRHIEVSSFVRADLVPQLADAAEVFAGITRRPDVRYTALVPNERGLERALDCGVDSVAVFTAASETFSRKNVGAGIDESLARIERVVRRALEAGAALRAYVSTAFVCPYEGRIGPRAVLRVLARLEAMGLSELSIGDTVGRAEPAAVARLLDAIAARPEASGRPSPLAGIALHMHDTGGRALENVEVGLCRGVEEFDASAGGLGGCPFAPGASGNLDTHALAAALRARGIETGIDLAKHDTAAALIRAAL